MFLELFPSLEKSEVRGNKMRDLSDWVSQPTEVEARLFGPDVVITRWQELASRANRGIQRRG